MNIKYRPGPLLLILFLLIAETRAKKIRFIGSAGGAPHNDVLNTPGLSGGGGLHIAYPVSPETNLMNVELAIANWYNVFPAGPDMMHLLRFGFGIRVYLNAIKALRPYFTHDITSHIVWVKSREGSAPTYGILLGLGIDIPIQKTNKEKKSHSSFFFDVSYNFFKLRYFNVKKESVRFLILSGGFSWKIRAPFKNK